MNAPKIIGKKLAYFRKEEYCILNWPKRLDHSNKKYFHNCSIKSTILNL